MPSTRHTHTTPTPSSCWKTRMQRSTGASPCMHSPISASALDLPRAWSSSEKGCVGRRKRLQDRFQAGDNVHRGENWSLGSEHCSTQLQCRPAPWPFTLLFLSQCHGPARALIPHYSLETRSVGTQYLLRTSTQKDGRGNNMQAYSKS